MNERVLTQKRNSHWLGRIGTMGKISWSWHRDYREAARVTVMSRMLRYCFYQTMSSPYNCHNFWTRKFFATIFLPNHKLQQLSLRLGTSACLNGNLLGDPGSARSTARCSKSGAEKNHRVFIKMCLHFVCWAMSKVKISISIWRSHSPWNIFERYKGAVWSEFKSFLFASQKQSNSLCRTAPAFHVRQMFDKDSVTMIWNLHLMWVESPPY